ATEEGRRGRAQGLLMRWLLLLSLAACATVPQGHARRRPADCALDGEEIVCGGNLFAELVCINRINRYAEPEVPPTSVARAGTRACRALGVHYYDDDTLVWLYRAPGFDPERPDLPFREAKMDMRRALTVVVSADGSKIHYRTGTLHP